MVVITCQACCGLLIDALLIGLLFARYANVHSTVRLDDLVMQQQVYLYISQVPAHVSSSMITSSDRVAYMHEAFDVVDFFCHCWQDQLLRCILSR
jgi:hypothetical protein